RMRAGHHPRPGPPGSARPPRPSSGRSPARGPAQAGRPPARCCRTPPGTPPCRQPGRSTRGLGSYAPAPAASWGQTGQVFRGTSLASGAKAIIMKGGDHFALLVLPADRKLDNPKVRKALGSKALRFASREEVEQLTGLAPGSIPPFGSLFGLPTHCDPALAE